MVPHDKDSEQSTDFQVLIDKLNLDQKTANQAWDSYQQIRSRVSLEGDQLNWIGCAVFVACRNTANSTTGQTALEENCVSLTSLLRYSNLSLVQFFDKIKKWAEMTKLNEEFRLKISTLESKVNITFKTFHSQYAPVFIKIFNVPAETESRHNRNRKQRPTPCSTKRVFEFCWLMFIAAKSENKSFDQNLVNSYQLLYALFDYIFRNAFLDERRDLLNPNFVGLPPNWIDAEYHLLSAEAPSIIEIIYEHKEDLTDVKYCKEYTLKSIIKGWLDKKVLAISGEKFTLLHSSVFDYNYNNLTKLYESYLSNNGDFDERIFLKEYFRQKSIMESSPAEHISSAPVSEMKGPCKVFITPLTCRQYLQPEQVSDSITTVPQNIARLKNILVGRLPAPSQDLLNIFKSLSFDPSEIVNNKFLELQTRYNGRCQEELGSSINDEERKNLTVRSNIIVTLAYKLMEDILKSERKNNLNVGPLIERLEFISSIFTCSVEIVEFSFNHYNDKFPRKFPWSLKVFCIPAFQMIKIIEITIRATNGQLSRNVIKHLMLIEETSLESLMWRHDSELWKEIEKDKVIPKFEDVALPHQINRVFNTNEKKENNPGLMSPVPSAVETFQSPNQSVDSLVKKNPFLDIKPGQSLLQNNHSAATHIVVEGEGTKKVLRLSDTASGELVIVSPKAPEIKPKKGGTLGIILRKFYNLAGVRMFELCKALNITELQQKIWTVLEYSVRETDLMKDRHLDQLLMCAVYVVCKLSQRLVQFADNIMKAYRAQPQATSDVYRKVNGEMVDGVYKELNLIEFYNTVYTEKVKEFALKFKVTDSVKQAQQNHRVHLSPLPSEKVLRASPRTEIVRNVFLIPYESPTKLMNSEHTMNYCFNRSTSAELKEINATVNSVKRKLPEEFDLSRRNVQKQSKIAALYEERKVQSKEVKPVEMKQEENVEVNFML